MKSILLFEDKDVIVIYKPAGLPTQTARIGAPDVVSEMKNHIADQGKESGEPYVGLVHRLDQPVEGILVLAKNERAAAELSRQNGENAMCKGYKAVVYGKSPILQGILIDYLVKEERANRSSVSSKTIKGAKKAELSYQVIKSAGEDECSCLEIKLKTGRHHQIRVQLAHAGMPLLGDLKYGTEKSLRISAERNIETIALCACELEFINPGTQKKLHYRIEPKGRAFIPYIGRG